MACLAGLDDLRKHRVPEHLIPARRLCLLYDSKPPASAQISNLPRTNLQAKALRSANSRDRDQSRVSNKSWDTAAGVIIAREAGARVVDLNGNAHSTESKETTAVSPGLADELLKILQVSTAESVNSHT